MHHKPHQNNTQTSLRSDHPHLHRHTDSLKGHTPQHKTKQRIAPVVPELNDNNSKAGMLRRLAATAWHHATQTTNLHVATTARTAACSGSICTPTSTSSSARRAYHVAQLASRGVISLRGDEAVQFMQVRCVLRLVRMPAEKQVPDETISSIHCHRYVHVHTNLLPASRV